MKFGRVFPSAGLIAAAFLAVAALAYWYLSSQRARLEEQTRSELAQAAQGLKVNLSALSSSAQVFFRSRKDHSPTEFARRNPYVTSVPGVNPGVVECAILESPQKLVLRSKEGKSELEISVDAGKILDDVAISDAFEYIFVADNSGRVKFALQHGEKSRHRGGRGYIDSQTREAAPRDQSNISLIELGGLTGSDKQPIKPSVLSQTSAASSVWLGTENYVMFTYPIAILTDKVCPDAHGVRSEATWVVGGLVDPRRLWTEAATLSPQAALVAALTLLLGFAVVPLVKPLVLRAGERFDFADACILFPCAFLFLMITTILLLGWGSSSRLNATAESGLVDLATSVEARLRGEYLDARSELGSLDQQFADYLANEQCREEVTAHDINNLLSQGNSAGPFKLTPHLYLNLAQVSWVDKTGMQVFKADVHSDGTPRVRVDMRPYFKETQAKRLWNLSTGRPSDASFFVQSLRGISTGELSATLAMSSKIPASCKGFPFVATMSMRPLTVERPVLPTGYSFAIIAADGQVLYHSDVRRALKEDFLSQIGDADALHSIMLGLRPGIPAPSMSTTYGRAPVDLHIRSISMFMPSGPQWYLVTLRDRRWINAASTEALVHSTIWCLATACGTVIFVGLALGMALARSTSQTKRNRKVMIILAWLWPNPDKQSLYRSLAWVGGVLLAAGLAIVGIWRVPDGAGLMWFSGLYPFVGLIAIVITVALSQRASQNPGHGWTVYYPAAAAGLLMAMAVVPAAGLFRHGWHREINKLEQFESDSLHRRLEDWKAEDNDYYKRQEIKVDRQDFFKRRYAGMTWFRIRYSTVPVQPSWLDQWLDQRLPFYDEEVESLRNQPSGGYEESTLPHDEQFTGLQAAAVALTPLPCVVLAFTALAMLWLLMHTIRTLFWTSDAYRMVSAGRDSRKVSRSVLLLASSPVDKNLLMELFDQRLAASAAVGAGLGGSSQAAEAFRVIDFEACMQDKQRREVALRTLERAGQDGEPWTVVLAESDPLRALSNGEIYAEMAEEEKERWKDVLGGLSRGASGAVGGGSSTAPQLNLIWARCSTEEQLTLIQVARGGFANPKDEAAVCRLLERGLLKWDPNLVLMSGEFEAVVHKNAGSAELIALEHPTGGIGWHQLRWIFFALLLTGFAFAIGTGQAWLQGATAMLTSLASGLEGVRKILTAVQRPSSLTPA